MIHRIWDLIEKEAGELTGLLKDKETPEGEVTKFLGRWQVRVGNYLTVIILWGHGLCGDLAAGWLARCVFDDPDES